MKTRVVTNLLATSAVAAAVAGIAPATASATPVTCTGSMNAFLAYNGECEGGAGTYWLEIDCIGYNVGVLPPVLGQYTVRKNLPLGQPGTVGCIAGNWSSAGYGIAGRANPA